MLAEVYGWFTEGFDTADLQEAKALMDELACCAGRYCAHRNLRSMGVIRYPAGLTDVANRPYNAARVMRLRLLRTGADMAATPRPPMCTIDTDHLDSTTADVHQLLDA